MIRQYRRTLSAATGQSIEAKATRWCACSRDAKRTAAICNDRPQLADGWLPVATPIAIKAVELVAGDLGVMLEADASLRERAEATVRAVDLEVEAMKRAGELRSVNQAYRQHRRAHPWCAWFDNYRAGLIRAAADLASEQGSGFDRHAIDGARIDPA